MYMAKSEFTSYVIKELVVALQSYTSPWWLLNGHVSTLLAARRGLPPISYDRQLLVVPNDGTVAIDWESSRSTKVRICQAYVHRKFV